MLAQKLRVEDVLALEHEMLSWYDFLSPEGREAEQMLAKIDGIHEAIQEVIKVIKEREDS